jgi:hypothetical protein
LRVGGDGNFFPGSTHFCSLFSKNVENLCSLAQAQTQYPCGFAPASKRAVRRHDRLPKSALGVKNQMFGGAAQATTINETSVKNLMFLFWKIGLTRQRKSCGPGFICLSLETLGFRDEALGVTEANLLGEQEQLLVGQFVFVQFNEQLGQHCLERSIAEPVGTQVFQ